MGENKNNILSNENALSEEELNKVTAGFGLFDRIASFLGKKKTNDLIQAGLTRPNKEGTDTSVGLSGLRR